MEVYQQDANALTRQLPSMDLAYFDPPYNQHPYGSNYFMLNLLVDYKRPINVSEVSGIPTDWRRSDYNVRSRCYRRLDELVHAVNAPYILVSFNDEGFIPPAEMRRLLAGVGKLETIEIPYNTFRGSRNLPRAKHSCARSNCSSLNSAERNARRFPGKSEALEPRK